ncbi:ABC transporter permease [Ekhidna sp. MALMAid0563]|uniref:ABC transporter permease n=1 Tax=Ekhidna sp. MALMAid0563 TaxID=3143937 RepID=UPI0032DEE80E
MKEKTPPKWALLFLRFFCKDHYLEQIEGDLLELFERNRSRRNFAWNTIRFFRWRYLKGLDDFEQLTTLAMIKNYLKVAIRTLLRQKSYAGINILGLAIGLASCLLIMMYVFHERSYDHFYPNSERIYRVANGENGRWTPELLAETMMAEYPQVEVATRISGLWESHFKIDNQSFFQDGAAWADANIFKVFGMEFVSGNPETALKNPEDLVLTESLAKKFFSNESVIGITIVVDGNNMKVTAVVKDPPKNTHFPFKFIGRVWDNVSANQNWTGNNFWTYAKIQEGVPKEEMNGKLVNLYKKYVGPQMIEFSGHATFEELMADYPDRFYGFTLHPLTEIHLENPHFSMGARGDKKNVIVFSLVALFILLIACVNYINMATARSAIRSKEVGIRKALGSYRKNIVTQFLIESILITLIAVILAIGISAIALPYFNQLTGRSFEFSDLFSFTNLLSIAAILIIVGLLAGGYPAYIISRFSPLKALRGQMQQAGKKSLRSGLVAFQFAISIFLVAATAVIYKQVMFMQSQDLGINLEQTLVINNGRQLGEKYQIFKNELEGVSDVEIVSKSSHLPFHGSSDWTYQVPNEDNRRISPNNGFASPDMEKVLGIEMVKGRFFAKNRVSDSASVVINESLAKELGWEDPINKELQRPGGQTYRVIGVMKDFNYTSLKSEIKPLIFRYGPINSEVGMFHQAYILAKVNTSDILATLNQVEQKWNEYVPDYPFDANFLDDSYQKQYESELKFGQVFTTFSLLAIIIAFLGLFALTTFVLQRRFKEIAVRKVLGATVPSLLRMMIQEFTRLVIIGGAVGIGVAFYWLNDWLEGYSYRIELSWYLLVLPIILILALTWVVVSAKSYRAAVSNPANALKEE